MNIPNTQNFDLDGLQSILEKQGFEAKRKKPLLGPNSLITTIEKKKYLISIKNSIIKFNIVVPIWWNLIALVLGLIAFSIAFTMISGDTVIVKGGFITLLVILLVADLIYKGVYTKNTKEAAKFIENQQTTKDNEELIIKNEK